ncbi:MAG TPA: hypothetical protein VGK32_09700 [Vicinamibacterales bacterium]|jgi:hypothetical protein
MARGWESKGVETQQEEAVRMRTVTTGDAGADERRDQTRRATLQLARARAVADLGRAKSKPHREMLERAIADLDEQLQG